MDSPPTRSHFNLSLRGVQRRGNLDEVEHTSANRRCYGDEIANHRIEYGLTMTKWVTMKGFAVDGWLSDRPGLTTGLQKRRGWSRARAGSD